MLNEISVYLKKFIHNFKEGDLLIYNNKLIGIDKNRFGVIPNLITPAQNTKTIAFVDGGQAEIISSGNFCLSFIKVGAFVFYNNKKINQHQGQFYLLTTAKYVTSGATNGLFYESKIFGDDLIKGLIDENDLFISSTDNSIKLGIERAPISHVANIARRFAELSLASQIEADFIVLDGTLEQTYTNEEKYLDKLTNLTNLTKLTKKICSVAKSSALFTVSGNSSVVLLNKLGAKFGFKGCWYYFAEENKHNTYFVKLHEKAKHVFRFMGDENALSLLMENSQDALFLGYPYGLVAVDKFIRVSKEEMKSLQMKLLLRAENEDIAEYLSTTNAHEILDNLG